MSEEDRTPQVEFERRFRELLQDVYQANPLSQECRPGLEVRPEGDRLVVIGHRKGNGEAVELGRLPRSWVTGKPKD